MDSTNRRSKKLDIKRRSSPVYSSERRDVECSDIQPTELSSILHEEYRKRSHSVVPGVGFERDASGDLVFRSISHYTANDLLKTVPEHTRKRVSERALRGALGLREVQDEYVGEIVCEGTINQFAEELQPWGLTSCMFNAFAFARSVYLFGIETVCQPHILDTVLRHGADFMRQRGTIGRGCYPYAMPSLVLSPGTDVFASMSGSFLIVPHGEAYVVRNEFKTVPDVRIIEGGLFVKEIWDKLHPNTDFLLIGVGSLGLAVKRQGDIAFVFDSHGTTSYKTPALVVKINIDHLHAFLSNFTDVNCRLPWLANFAYFLPAGQGKSTELTCVDVYKAMSSVYGTSDFSSYKAVIDNTVSVKEEIAGAVTQNVLATPTVRSFHTESGTMENMVSGGTSDRSRLGRRTPHRYPSDEVTAVAVGFRNQYSIELGKYSSISCMRSSLAFLRLTFSYGIESALSAEAVDSSILQGRDWTEEGTRQGRTAGMCAIVQLPTRIKSSERGGELCCVFSRTYGECDFYDPPAERFMSTQITARQFFENIWSSRRESYTIATIGAIGIGIYRNGDDVYFYDPHGHGEVSQAFIARVPAGNVYAYIAGYAGTGMLWAASLVYFVTAGPDNVTADELTAAVSRLYGVGETYLVDETFVEFPVTATMDNTFEHPPPKLTSIRVGGCPVGGWPDDDSANNDNNITNPSDELAFSPLPSTIGSDQNYERPIDGGLEEINETVFTDSNAWADAINYTDTYQPAPPLPIEPLTADLVQDNGGQHKTRRRTERAKRHRPQWTPQSSTENLSASRESVSGRPTRSKQSRLNRTSRNYTAQPSSVPSGPFDASTHSSNAPQNDLHGQIDEDVMRGIVSLRHRSPLTITTNTDVTASEYPRPLGIDVDELKTHAERIDELAEESVNMSVWVSRPIATTNNDLLEQFLLSIYTRTFAFLIENGARTRPDKPSSAGELIKHIIDSFPKSTAVGSFITSTAMTLSEVPAHCALMASVKAENARLGGLALAKLVLMAVDVDVATDDLHDALDALEAEVSNSDPAGAYEKLASGLVTALRMFSGGIYSQVTSHHSQKLTERIKIMCEGARDKEICARKLGASLASDLNAIENGVMHMKSTMDAFDVSVTGQGGSAGGTTGQKILTSDVVQTKLNALRSEVIGVFGDAVREYYLKGAAYSARAIMADKTGGQRFHVATAAIAQLERMAESAGVFDESVAALADKAKIVAPPPVSKSKEVILLRDLLSTGADLSTDDALGTWAATMSEAHSAGKVDKRELDNLLREISHINDRAARQASAGAEMSRFGALSAAVDQALISARSAEASNVDPSMAFDTLLKCAEDLVRQTKAMETQSGPTSGLSDELKTQISTRRREAESIIAEVKDKTQKIAAYKENIYSHLKQILRPIPGFVGLRAFPTSMQALQRQLPSASGNIVSVLASSPGDVIGRFRTDLWTLFTNYREMLEQPSVNLASTSAGLGVPFTMAIEAVSGGSTNELAAVEFFKKHADGISEALSNAAADQKSESAARLVLHRLDTAITAIDAVMVTATTTQTPYEFAFLKALRNKAAKHLEGIIATKKREDVLRELNRAAESAASAAARARMADPTADKRDSQDEVIAEARSTASDAVSVVNRIEKELALMKESSQSTQETNGGQYSRVTDKDLNKAAMVVRQMASDVETVAAEYERKRGEMDETRSSMRWKEDADTWLRKAETRSEFDASELKRLRDIADAKGYNGKEMRNLADRVVQLHASQALAALETVFRFNPYTPENMRAKTVPPMSLLRNMTWGDSFIASSSGMSALFGSPTEPLMQLLRIAINILNHSNASNGFPSYYDIIHHMERDLALVPTLSKYVTFYQKGHAEFEVARAELDALRADVLQASGRIPSEIAKAIEEITYVKNADYAKTSLKEGIKLAIPSEDVIAGAVDFLKKFNQTPFKDSAYAEYIAHVIHRDTIEIAAAMAKAKDARSEATARAQRILRDVVDASEAADVDTAANLVNLKNLLRLAPIPSYIGKAIDRADSADDLVTQAALLLAKVEETDELDTQAIEWLRQARSIIDSHPLTVRIDEQGPMAPYIERIEKLSALSHAVEELRTGLTAAEAAWDETWENFNREKGRIESSSDGFLVAKDRASSVNAAMTVVLSMRVTENYRRLPPKLIGTLETKYSERSEALEVFNSKVKDIESIGRQLDGVLSRIPHEFDQVTLKSLLAAYDENTKKLPKWYTAGTARYRELIVFRLAMYDAYATLTPTNRPMLVTRKTRHDTDGPNREWLLRSRVAAMMNDTKAVFVLREASTETDTIIPSYLDSSDTPFQYSLAYRSVGDKMAAMLCCKYGKQLRPKITRGSIADTEAVVSAGVVREILNLRLGYEAAIGSDFSTFSRFVRMRRPDWDVDNPTRSAAEIYSAVIATTWSRHFAEGWNKIYFPADASGPIQESELRESGINVKKTVEMDLSDVMVTLVAWSPIHLACFSRLDLVRQHEYMDRTLTRAAAKAFASRIFVTTLDINPRVTGGKQAGRPVPPNNDPNDPTGGSLFAIRFSDWKPGQLSDTDPLKIWHGSGEVTNAAIAKIREAIPSKILPTITVLARMCIPPNTLSSMWTTLKPEDLVSEMRSYDGLVTTRLDASTTLNAMTTSTDLAVTSSAGRSTQSDERVPLYTPTGNRMTFTLVAAPPTEAVRVNAMDLASCAALFGAQVVIAMECPCAYSKESGLTLCLRLFDTRRGAGSPDISPGISSDLSSWGSKLLNIDDNPIENACLTSQLEQLSSLIASKPLSEVPPCLIIVDSQLNPSRVLWPKHNPPNPPTLKLVADDIISQLPFVETDEEVFASVDESKDHLFANLIGGTRLDFANDKSWYPTCAPSYKFTDSDPFPYAISGEEDPYTEDDIFNQGFCVEHGSQDNQDTYCIEEINQQNAHGSTTDSDDELILRSLLDDDSDDPDQTSNGSPPEDTDNNSQTYSKQNDSGCVYETQPESEHNTRSEHTNNPEPRAVLDNAVNEQGDELRSHVHLTINSTTNDDKAETPTEHQGEASPWEVWLAEDKETPTTPSVVKQFSHETEHESAGHDKIDDQIESTASPAVSRHVVGDSSGIPASPPVVDVVPNQHPQPHHDKGNLSDNLQIPSAEKKSVSSESTEDAYIHGLPDSVSVDVSGAAATEIPNTEIGDSPQNFTVKNRRTSRSRQSSAARARRRRKTAVAIYDNAAPNNADGDSSVSVEQVPPATKPVNSDVVTPKEKTYGEPIDVQPNGHANWSSKPRDASSVPSDSGKYNANSEHQTTGGVSSVVTPKPQPSASGIHPGDGREHGGVRGTNSDNKLGRNGTHRHLRDVECVQANGPASELPKPQSTMAPPSSTFPLSTTESKNVSNDDVCRRERGTTCWNVALESTSTARAMETQVLPTCEKLEEKTSDTNKQIKRKTNVPPTGTGRKVGFVASSVATASETTKFDPVWKNDQGPHVKETSNNSRETEGAKNTSSSLDRQSNQRQTERARAVSEFDSLLEIGSTNSNKPNTNTGRDDVNTAQRCKKRSTADHQIRKPVSKELDYWTTVASNDALGEPYIDHFTSSKHSSKQTGIADEHVKPTDLNQREKPNLVSWRSRSDLDSNCYGNKQLQPGDVVETKPHHQDAPVPEEETSTIDPWQLHLSDITSTRSESVTSCDDDGSSLDDHDPNSEDKFDNKRRVVLADNLITRRSFRKSGRSALRALMEACRKIAINIRRVRETMTAKGEDLAMDIFKIRIILGSTI
ncbi:large tegument protein [Spheniscid alphaherpesvirus 1]|uniref:Large tegument protein n=1 Tax=Spheniscid alphaherpesvirus 1 TaxID=2560777 RepID=A0A1R3T1V5_9ALPH|nr:large tegument protein [Spheniscid alphaherpesvirus 1]